MNTKQAEDILGLDVQARGESIGISIAAPDEIRSWSSGEIKNPETINYRTFNPEKGGLFCERIFGPTKDWECSCGKYKRIKHKGVICDRCGVEVTRSRVRRERMGHIELAVPVSHIWFFKSAPSRMGLVLDMTVRDIEQVIYYESYIVTDPGDTPLEKKELLSETEYFEAQDKYGIASFKAYIGAAGIRKLLEGVDFEEAIQEVEEKLQKTRSKQTRKKLARRVKVLKGLHISKSKPEWMVMEVLPVIPPDLRPLVPLEGGRFATSDLNDLYRRVINRNNRLKNLMALKTPEVIIQNEKRMLQQSVDALLDNGRHGRTVNGSGNRPLKSLSEMLRGKQGRFRQNLLGKRVDYSGRSVIVVGPHLKLNQCGLPKKMALVLFEPFIIRRLKERGLSHTVRSAKKMIEREEDVVWDILEKVTKGHTVMLNRAPTLHRLGIQSFEPLLIEGEAIQLHPLVCGAYNADFDGDQMAVHVPLSIEAQMESRALMLAPNNIFSPSSGDPVMTPSQDMTLGCYFLTSESQARRTKKAEKDASPVKLPIFSNTQEVYAAYHEGGLQVWNRIRLRNPDCGRDTIYGQKDKALIITTVGRVFFNEVWPDELGFANILMNKKAVGKMILRCVKIAGRKRTVKALDAIKELGFQHATLSGISIGMDDMIIPEDKGARLAVANQEVQKIKKQYEKGIITARERYNKIVDLWTYTNEELTNEMYSKIENNAGRDDLNPVYVMVDSGARGSRQQIRQLAGMRGLMAKPSGEIIERPITSNFREGLGVLEYFISTHGARKGLADTALKTADSGYLTRKLVDVAHDVIIIEEDCSTLNGMKIEAITEGDKTLVPLSKRIIGRTVLDDLIDPHTHEVIVPAGNMIDGDAAERIEMTGIERVKVRSILSCDSAHGVCAKCYGLNLATGHQASVGDSVGVIAAQSIGEPGTQLTMRTFHIGGTASSVFKQPEITAGKSGYVQYKSIRKVTVDGKSIVLNKNGTVHIVGEDGGELETHNIVMGAVISIKDGDWVEAGEKFVEWDPYIVPIICEHDGEIDFHDFIEGVTVGKGRDDVTGLEEITLMEHKEDHHPQIIVKDPKTGKPLSYYPGPSGAHVMVERGQKVKAGETLAKTPRKAAKTKDITGGLPRVTELVEARSPKDAAEIAKIEGEVSFAGITRGKRKLIVADLETGTEEEHLIPIGKHVIVYDGDHVQKGQQLTEGPVVPQEVLEVCGPEELQKYLVNEIQSVYRLQGVSINDKHIELIVRQMLRKVRITDPGDTEFLWGEQIDKNRFQSANHNVVADGKRAAEAKPILLGITKASLQTESFISAASFQETTRILTDAAVVGRKDYLRGFKENVIMGNLIPAGTGFPTYRNVSLAKLGEELSYDEMLDGTVLEEKESEK